MRVFTFATAALTLALAAGGCRPSTDTEDPLACGIALMQSGSNAAARDALIAATALYTNSATAHCNLGLVYRSLGDNTAAIASLTRAVDLADGDPRPLELLAHALIQAGNAQGARKILSNVETPTETTLTLMGLAAYRAGSSDLARSYLGQALELNHNYAPALYNLALLCRDASKTQREALAYYKRFQKVAPNNRRATETPQAFISLGDAIAPLEDTPPPAFEPKPRPADIVEPEPSPPPAVDEAAVRKQLATAKLELSRGNVDIALFALKDAVNKHPESPDALWALRQLYEQNLEDKTRATDLHETFSKKFPNDARSITIVAPSVTPLPTPPRMTEQEPGMPPGEADFRSGLALYAAKDWPKAIAAYQKALGVNPESARTTYNLGLAYKASGNLDKASKSFTVALGIQKDMPKALYMLGLTEMQRGENKAALEHLNRLLRVQPDFAKAHYLLGRIYRDAGRPDMVRIHFEHFLHLNPTGASANHARQWMEQHKDDQQE
jgi:tetratricopeptide (TPR) repeat protein